jgi:hypothetical protein
MFGQREGDVDVHHRHYRRGGTALERTLPRHQRREARREPPKKPQDEPKEVDLETMARAANLPSLGAGYDFWVGDGADYCA